MKKLFALLVFCASLALAQTPPPGIMQTGYNPPVAGNCNNLRVGDIAVQSGNPTAGYSGAYICLQYGAATQGVGTFTWAAIAIDPPGTTGYTLLRKQVSGVGSLTSASPSTLSVTGLPFANQNSFQCFVNNETNVTHSSGLLATGRISGAAMTLTGPNTVTDVLDWYCIGY